MKIINRIVFIVLVFGIITSIGSAYYRYVIKKDFLVFTDINTTPNVSLLNISEIKKITPDTEGVLLWNN